ncbi:putative MFS-type transporter [Smittium culicis]|uniref:Putative MFS-type transporter n=1 Tax=Smittium culicis TaxID=133412 RepID=A0A1R1Y060_9FUNG|nr:putative MFS-type transporter [Smittium culicis]
MIKSITTWFKTRNALLWLASLSLLIDALVYGIIIPALPDILQRDMGASTTVNGLLIAFYGLGVLIGAPTVSYYSDKHEVRRMPMVYGFILLAVSSMGIGLSKKVYQLFIARLGQGIASGVTWSLGLAMLIDVYPSDKLDSPISIVYSCYTIGVLGGPFIGGVIYKYGGIMSIAYLITAISVLNLAFRILVPDTKELRAILAISDAENEKANNKNEVNKSRISEELISTNKENSSEQDIPSDINREKTVSEDRSDLPEAYLGFFDLIKDARILVCCFVVVLTYGVLGSLEVVLPIVFDESYKLTPDKIGYTFIAFSVPSVISGLIVGRLVNSKYMNSKFGTEKKRYVVMFLGNAIAGVFTICIGFSKTIPLNIVFMSFVGFFTGAGNVSIMAAMGSHVCIMGKRKLETGLYSKLGGGANSMAYSLFNVSFSIAVIILPLLSSVILKATSIIVVCILLGIMIITGVSLSIGYVYFKTKD